MLLIMRNFFIKTIVVSFCFVSFNTQAFESIYLVCSGNNQTMVFGFIETLKDKFDNIGRDGTYFKFATGYLANSKVNEFDKKTIGLEGRSGDASVRPKELLYDYFKIDRVTGELTEWWLECDDERGDSYCSIMGEWDTKSKLIGSCNKVSESEAKAKAKQLYRPAPEPKRKF